VPKPEQMYKTEHALTCRPILLKDSVANDVINVIVCLRQNYVKNFKC